MANISEGYISQDDFDEICNHIRSGLSVRKFDFKSIGKAQSSFYCWMDLHASKEQLEQYVRARDAQADALFDECLDIADDDSLDIGFKDDGTPFVKGENIQRSKVRIETRMRMVGKMRPKKYGEKTILAGDRKNPIVTKNIDVSKLSDQALREIAGLRHGSDES